MTIDNKQSMRDKYWALLHGVPSSFRKEKIIESIEKEIALALKEQREEIVEMIELYRKEKGFTCANFAIDEIIKNIKQD